MSDELIARLKDDRDTIQKYQAERGVTVFTGLIADLEAAIAALGGVEPVAVRYDGDGYGYRYIDNGSGSDWLTRHKDGEPLYALPAPPSKEG